MNNLEKYGGKVAVITGAARGIGLGIARRFGITGARVIIVDNNRSSAEKAVTRLRALGIAADFVYTDLSMPGAAISAIQESAELAGRLDILVNNARGGSRLDFLEETEENWDTTNFVSLKAAFFAAQAAVKIMGPQGGGCILNISSVAATLSTNESPSYHASKSGLQQLSRYLAVAAGPFNVRVNAILPGLIVQDEHRKTFEASDNEKYRKMAEFYQPLGQVGTEDDVAEAALFLCSEEARYISGSCLVLDGGATVQDQFGMLMRSTDASRMH
jgi:NAD(P)-dependent dehydrogenase (short-subunit alcohol dehydrogenase family)